MFELKEKKALVTGATGGLGEAIARALHGDGASVQARAADEVARRLHRADHAGCGHARGVARAPGFGRNAGDEARVSVQLGYVLRSRAGILGGHVGAA